MEQTVAGVQQEQAGQPVPAPGMANPAEQTAPVQPGQAQQDPDVMAATEAIRRAQHSQIDAQAKRVAQVVNSLKAQGIPVSAEQVIRMMYESAGSAPGQVPNQQAQQAAMPIGDDAGQEMPSDPVVREAVDVMTEIAGKQLDESDPEFELIDKETDRPSVFLASVRKAAEAYAARTGNIANPARIPSLAGGSGTHVPSHANKSATDGLNDYFADWRRKQGL